MKNQRRNQQPYRLHAGTVIAHSRGQTTTSEGVFKKEWSLEHMGFIEIWAIGGDE
jgi:hypothetical protein